MKTVTKVKAFTLSELLVVLLLTTVVVGMAYAVLHLVQKQMYGIHGNFERNTELNLLRQSLWTDFNQYDGVWYDAQTQELIFANGLDERIYQIHEAYIVEHKDTFQVKIEEQLFFFKGKERVSGEIDALHFKTSKELGAKPVFVFKRNAATSYLND